MSQLIIFDWNRTLFDPDAQAVYPEASVLLGALKNNTIVLISRGVSSDPRLFLGRMGLIDVFSEIIVTKKKTTQLFRRIKIKNSATSFWVIGDKLDSEIACGNRAGFTTIRVRQGKFAETLPNTPDEQPCFEVGSLLGCIGILSS
ncbi:MAG: HAD hydrolase-like protein [bacterium]